MMTCRRVALCHCHGNVLSVCLSVCLSRPVLNYTRQHDVTLSQLLHPDDVTLACSAQPRFINAR